MSAETSLNREGKETSEYKEAKKTGWLAWAGLIIGYLVTASPQILETVTGVAGKDSMTAKIVGGILMAVSVLAKLASSNGYIKSRTDVKRSIADMDIAKNLPKK